ncbi:ankyrin [Rickenella mellea]|uniref:Ankyrin n=1 Tax=Rickenella mellea TaxID=50990 RepID=A0A4Y7QG81_9AGAM|nr:ankyrin [Rickenella mellea]
MARIQTAEAEAFLKLVSTKGLSLDDVLKPALADEAELRKLFATDRQNARLSNPYVGLIDVFDAPSEIRTTRARVVQNENDKLAKYLLPLADDVRRKDGEPCMAESLETFQKNWSIFTEGSLSQSMDWSNVVAAGGSVLACLLPLSDSAKESKRTIRKYFHANAYPTSDIDLFMWGLNAEQAEAKMHSIFEAVRDSVPWDVTCVRTKHVISIHSQYPYRSVQIVLRLYHSPAEILAGFDVDAPCVLYDGQHVFANPRAIVAMMRQCNTVDMTRRSPSYEIRLAKYSSRGFEVFVPDLRREDVDPTIYERSINRIEGLARLLVLEKLSDPDARDTFNDARRALRKRPTVYRNPWRVRRLKGDLKSMVEIGGLQMNDYDVVSLHIPYGPGWTAKRIDALVYKTDLGTNSTFNPKNKGRRLHRHSAFFGTMQECLEDCCEYCPEPKKDEEKALQEEEDKTYIRGRVAFIQDDPGRQSMTGSFKPIDVGEWSAQAYIGLTEKFFTAIASLDRVSVQRMIAEGIDVNRRDHVGRTPLHVAIICKAVEICGDLIDAGARMTARLVDGRTSLHLAAQYDLPEVVGAMLERSGFNEKEAEEKERAEKEAKAIEEEKDADGDSTMADDDDGSEAISSEDDWSSEEEEEKKSDTKKSGQADSAMIPDDNLELPDVFEVDALDWDFSWSALTYAILAGSLRSIDVLLAEGADPKLAMKSTAGSNPAVCFPLTFCISTINEDLACAVIERLVQAGATTSQADDELRSVFHTFVFAQKQRLVTTALRVDPKARVALNVPLMAWKARYPLVSAIVADDYALTVLLLANGAITSITAEDYDKATQMLPNQRQYYRNSENNYLERVFTPAEVSIAMQNHLIHLLVECGAPVSLPVMDAVYKSTYQPTERRSLVEWVQDAIDVAKQSDDKVTERTADNATRTPKTFLEKCAYLHEKLVEFYDKNTKPDAKTIREEEEKRMTAIRSRQYLEVVLCLLQEQGAKTWDTLYPDQKREIQMIPTVADQDAPSPRLEFLKMTKYYSNQTAGTHELDQYKALFEACWTGDVDRIQELCLPEKASKTSKPPIQIMTKIQVSSPSNSGLQKDNRSRYNYTSVTGSYTPFSVAILARRWDVAKLVLATAIAQYKIDEITPPAFVTTNITLTGSDAESEADSDDTEMEDDPEVRRMPEFVDVAHRRSGVQCNAPPQKFFTEANSPRLSSDGSKVLEEQNVFVQAVADCDLEGFVRLFDLAGLLPNPDDLDISWMLHNILEVDSPELLDEYIRRSGDGLLTDGTEFEDDTMDDDGNVQESKLYLGLNVHGKKRKDWAKSGQDIQTSNEQNEPLLWKAARMGATKIITYLSTDKPLAAYQFYARTATTDDAKYLRRLTDLPDQLPKMLGVLPNSYNETPLLAALTSEKEKALTTMKLIVSDYPSRAKSYLHSCIRTLGFTPLFLAVYQDAEPKVVDWLIGNGLSVEVTDYRGWNILHTICAGGFNDLLQYFLDKLSEDVLNRLLLQTTRERMNTPLMNAVKMQRLRAIEILFQSNKKAVIDSLTIPDIDGCLPLHIAARDGRTGICSLLASHGPPDALFTENAVGNTPLDDAAINWRSFTTPYRTKSYISGVPTLQDPDMPINIAPLNAVKLETQIHNLKGVVAQLENEGKLWSNKKLHAAVKSFLVYLENKLNEEKDYVFAEPEKTGDSIDGTRVYEILLARATAITCRRRLVHISDVQRSIASSLEASKKVKDSAQVHDNELGRDNVKVMDERVEMEKRWSGVLRHRCCIDGLDGRTDLI